MAITDRRHMGHRPLHTIAEAVAHWGGKLIVQIREPDLPARMLYEWIEALLPEIERQGAMLVVSGRADIALCFNGVGVQLPETGLPANALRGRFPKLPMGRSVHDLEGALKARADGADWITLSPIFPSPSKPDSRGLGMTTLEKVASAVAPLPVFALGGLRFEDEAAAHAAGAHGIAGISGFWRPRD